MFTGKGKFYKKEGNGLNCVNNQIIKFLEFSLS